MISFFLFCFCLIVLVLILLSFLHCICCTDIHLRRTSLPPAIVDQFFFFSVFPHCSRFDPDELPTSVTQTDTHRYRHRDSETEKERCWKMLHEVNSACILSSLLCFVVASSMHCDDWFGLLLCFFLCVTPGHGVVRFLY